MKELLPGATMLAGLVSTMMDTIVHVAAEADSGTWLESTVKP